MTRRSISSLPQNEPSLTRIFDLKWLATLFGLGRGFDCVKHRLVLIAYFPYAPIGVVSFFCYILFNNYFK